MVTDGETVDDVERQDREDDWKSDRSIDDGFADEHRLRDRVDELEDEHLEPKVALPGPTKVARRIRRDDEDVDQEPDEETDVRDTVKEPSAHEGLVVVERPAGRKFQVHHPLFHFLFCFGWWKFLREFPAVFSVGHLSRQASSWGRDTGRLRVRFFQKPTTPCHMRSIDIGGA